MTAREPVAGIWGFYPLDKDLLLKSIKRCYLDKEFGPGKLPEDKSQESVHGGIAPHAGYTYSGPCTAWLYLDLAEKSVDFDTVVVIGTNHTGFGGDLTTTSAFDEWITPLGRVLVDMEVVRGLLGDMRGIVDNRRAHEQEHSIEVQIPFAQFALKGDWRLVPIVTKPFTPDKARYYAENIMKVLGDLDRKPLFIVSSDFTHHGPMYGYVLYTVNPIDKVGELDRSFIKKITEKDTIGFFNMVREYNSTICGWPGIMILMEIARGKGWELRLLKYYNSGELTGDPSVIVGYSSLSMRES
ncbi:MAG: AmmeMemoRadiSam system protein B [Desulfurococcales archaeon]|nr:AmmeMemoRadiSam system protein B [Desulfurococcales archaeon]